MYVVLASARYSKLQNGLKPELQTHPAG